MSIDYRGEKFSGYNKPKNDRTKTKKFSVLAKSGDTIKLIRFGDANMTIGKSNTCKPISTTQIEFKDMYECTVYGYSYSEQVIIELGAEFINTYGAYTKFSCEQKELV
jgi:hypothetical protein